MSRVLAAAALLLAAACGGNVLDHRDIAALGGTPGPAQVSGPALARVQPPEPIALHGKNLATLPAKRTGVPRVLFLGDSIAAGFGVRKNQAFPSVLADRLADEGVAIEVLNGGVFGFTSFGGLALPDLASLRPDVVVVELGGNDFLHGISLEITRRNLEQILRAGRDMGARVLLVGVVLPNFLRKTERGQAFEQLYPTLADELSVPLVPDMFADILGNPRFMQQDAIHPTAEGQMVVADNVLPGLRPLVLAVLGR